MHDTIARLVPETHVGGLVPRAAFASEIAARLGTEVVQMAMADTFGMTSTPAYYASMPEDDLLQIIAEIQSRRFGETVAVPHGRSLSIGRATCRERVCQYV